MPPKGTSKALAGKTAYVSKQPGADGLIHYTEEENAIWHDLITRQVPMLEGRACPQWISCLDEMNFPTDRIPQLGEISEMLNAQPRTDHRFAAFVQAYGEAGLRADPKDHAMLARLFWFTVEFGLVRTDDTIHAYGSGIMSSPGELKYAVESDIPERKPFDPVDVLRTPYRIDILQPIYFVIDSFDQLFDLAQQDLLGYISEARRLGMHQPKFPPKEAA